MVCIQVNIHFLNRNIYFNPNNFCSASFHSDCFFLSMCIHCTHFLFGCSVNGYTGVYGVPD